MVKWVWLSMKPGQMKPPLQSTTRVCRPICALVGAAPTVAIRSSESPIALASAMPR
jgi:hypothetical protein